MTYIASADTAKFYLDVDIVVSLRLGFDVNKFEVFPIVRVADAR